MVLLGYERCHKSSTPAIDDDLLTYSLTVAYPTDILMRDLWFGESGWRRETEEQCLLSSSEDKSKT